MGACGDEAFNAGCASIVATAASQPSYETPRMPTFPLFPGTFLISHSIVSYVSVLSSTDFASFLLRIGRFIMNCPSEP